MKLKNFISENKTMLILLFLLVVLYVIMYKTEEFSAKKRHNKKHSKKHMKKHMKRTVHAKQHPDSKSLTTLDPGTDSRNYHLVNNREIILSNMNPNYNKVFLPYFPASPTETLASASGTTNIEVRGKWHNSYILSQPAAGLIYGPFTYGSTDSFPIPQGAEVKYRIYAIYSDTLTSGSIDITFKFGWNNDKGSFTTSIPLTWGSMDSQRDGYSDFFTADDIKNSGGDPTQHANIYINVNGTNNGKSANSAIWRLYIQTYYIYKN